MNKLFIIILTITILSTAGCTKQVRTTSSSGSDHSAASYESTESIGNDSFWGAVRIGLLAIFLGAVVKESKE